MVTINKYSNIVKKLMTRPFKRRSNIGKNLYSKFLTEHQFVYGTRNKYAGNYNLYNLATLNSTVMGCVGAITKMAFIDNFEITTKNKNDDLNNDPMKKAFKEYFENIFQYPSGENSLLNFSHLHHASFYSTLITGDGFIEVNHDAEFGAPSQFNYIPPELLTLREDNGCFAYRDNPELYYEPENIIHIFKPDITFKNKDFGLSPVDAITQQLKIMFTTLSFNMDLLENDGLHPNAILTFDKDLTDESFKEALENIEVQQQSMGPGGILSVKGGYLTSAGLSNKDMEWVILYNACRDNICTRYEVPPLYAGISEGTKLGAGTGIEERRQMKDTVRSWTTLFENAYNRHLGRNGYNELLDEIFRKNDLVFRYGDFDVEDEASRAEIEAILVRNYIKTPDEIRAEHNLKPYPTEYYNPFLTKIEDIQNEHMMPNKSYINNGGNYDNQ